MTGLLRLVREHADAVEADLQRYYHVDLRDLWRPGRQVTWRRVAVLLRHVPHDAATRALLGGWATWSLTDHLLDDVRRTLRSLAGDKDPRPHPLRFPTLHETTTPERQRRLAAARARARARRARVAAGEIT